MNLDDAMLLLSLLSFLFGLIVGVGVSYFAWGPGMSWL